MPRLQPRDCSVAKKGARTFKTGGLLSPEGRRARRQERHPCLLWAERASRRPGLAGLAHALCYNGYVTLLENGVHTVTLSSPPLASLHHALWAGGATQRRAACHANIASGAPPSHSRAAMLGDQRNARVRSPDACTLGAAAALQHGPPASRPICPCPRPSEDCAVDGCGRLCPVPRPVAHAMDVFRGTQERRLSTCARCRLT